MRNEMTRSVNRIMGGLLGGSLLLMGGCSALEGVFETTPKITGQWQPITVPALYFSGVNLPADALDKGYPDVCEEAQSEIRQQLNRQLPAVIKPLRFYPQRPADGVDYVELSMTMTECTLDSDQTGGSFRFYLSLGFTLELTQHLSQNHSQHRTAEDGLIVMRRHVVIHDQTGSSTPSPLYEFSFVDPVRYTLKLFDGAQVLVP